MPFVILGAVIWFIALLGVVRFYATLRRYRKEADAAGLLDLGDAPPPAQVVDLKMWERKS